MPTSGRVNNIVKTVVDLQNPFSSPLVITNIQANVTARGQYLGSITVDTTFNAAGNQANLSPELDFVLNLFPPTVFSLLRQLVQESGQDVLPLDGVVQLGQYTYLYVVLDQHWARLSPTLAQTHDGPYAAKQGHTFFTRSYPQRQFQEARSARARL